MFLSSARPVKQQPKFMLVVVESGALLAAMAGSMAILALPAMGRDMAMLVCFVGCDSHLVVQAKQRRSSA